MVEVDYTMKMVCLELDQNHQELYQDQCNIIIIIISCYGRNGYLSITDANLVVGNIIP